MYLKNLFPGFCERIARQTANLVRTNQYPHLHKAKNKGYHRGRRSTFPRVIDSFQSRSSYPVEYVDYDNFPQEFSLNYDEDQNVAFEDVTMKEDLGPKGRRGTVLNIDAQDKRPKCQPIGAQIDCRFVGSPFCTSGCTQDFSIFCRVNRDTLALYIYFISA